MPARSFGPYSSDGIPVRAGAKVQLRVKQTSGDPQQLAKLRFGIAQLEPQGSGGLTLPAFGGDAPSGPTVELGVISANNSDDSFWIFDEVTGAETSTSRNVGIVAMNRDIARCPITGDLFVGDGANFKRLEAGTLDPLWSQPRENVGGNGRTRVSPDGTLLAHSGGTMVDVHDAETGAFIAATPADSQSGSNPNVPGFETNERLIFAGRFVSNADVAYYDLDPITDPIDQLLVSAGIGGFFASGLGCAEGIIVAGSSGGVVTRLDLSGTILWQTSSGSGTNPHVYAIEIDVENERAYALRRLSSAGPAVIAVIDVGNGNVLDIWDVGTESIASSGAQIWISDDRSALYVSCNKGLFKFNTADGSEAWSVLGNDQFRGVVVA